MKKLLIYQYLTILAFALVFSSCEKKPTTPTEEMVEVTINVETIGMEVTSLKSLLDDPFGAVVHSPPNHGHFMFYQAKNCNDVCLGIDCDPWREIDAAEDNFLDIDINFPITQKILLQAGNYQVTSLPDIAWIETKGWVEFWQRPDYHDLNLNENNWILPCLRDYKAVTTECQPITMENPYFTMTIVPMDDCIAIYDPASLFESISMPFSEEITKDSPYLHTYDNNLTVGYVRDFLSTDYNLKLKDGRNYVLTKNGVERNEFYPLFIKISVMPPSVLSVDIISYNDTISYIF